MSRSENNAGDRILLEGMVFHGRHGTLPAERELGQPFVVDVELRLDLRPAGLSDDLMQTVDYGEVHRRAREIVEGEPRRPNRDGRREDSESYPGGSSLSR
jgi:7,8-dihydroneopterin aldolase/epimerase/oxygenase